MQTVRQITDRTYNIRANILFTDFKLAFDSIYRSKMLKILKNLKNVLLIVIMQTPASSEARAVVENDIRKIFNVNMCETR
jgi:hypothetical protein